MLASPAPHGDGRPRFRQRWQPRKLFSRKQGVALPLLALTPMRHLPDKCWLSAIGASTSATSSLRNHDIFGDGVNVAARLEALAVSGRICVSRRVRDNVRDSPFMPSIFRTPAMGVRGTESLQTSPGGRWIRNFTPSRRAPDRI